MRDVPERCPFCNSGDRREETWQGRPAYSFSCGTVCYANGEVALRYVFCYAREKERAIREQLAAARTEAERWRKQYEALRAEMERLQGALNISPDDVGRIMHESWSRTKRSQGFHHPSECPNGQWVETARGRAPCPKCHTDLIPWDNLPEPQKDINRHAFDDVLAEIRRRAAIAERGLVEERDDDD